MKTQSPIKSNKNHKKDSEEAVAHPRLVRRLLVRLEGTDYKARFEKLAKHYALDLTEAHEKRDEARELCRWAIPRLRAMCHDFDATATGWACAEKMEDHPDIFPPNVQVEQPAPTKTDEI